MFKFELGQSVKVSISGEAGKVTGRADYAHSDNQYLLHMKGADGRAVDAWFNGAEIESTDNKAGLPD